MRRWGLIPPWAEDERIASRQINARVETVADKPAYRHALRERRCIVPADGSGTATVLPGNGIPAQACGWNMQSIDLASCTLTNVVVL